MHKDSQVITLGCRLNFWESDKINSIIKRMDKKNLVVFNTCSVTNEAVKNAKKYIRSFHKINPEVKIAVTGCAVESDLDIFKNMNEVSFIVSNKNKLSEDKWDIIKKSFKNKSLDPLNFNISIKENPSNSNIRKFVRVQSGCDHSCTFCIIPKCRGESKSDSIERVNEEISKNLKNGVKEIILTGVDLTSWTDNKYKSSKLGDLLDNIFKKNSSLFRLRLSSIDAAEIDDKLLYLVKNEPRLMPHFHFSLQSLDDLILKRMKRRHNVGQIINLFDIIRKARPHVTFGADFICGFPTESDSMFFNTIKNVKKLNITHLHVFPYSSKHGTPASRMPQVDLYKRRKRAKILRELGKKNYVGLLKKEIKYKHNILIETFNGIGKTENNIKVKVKNSKKGDLIITKLSSFNDDFLIL